MCAVGVCACLSEKSARACSPDVRGITCDQQPRGFIPHDKVPELRFGPLFVFMTTGRKDTRLRFGCGSAMVDASSSVPYATAASAAHNQHPFFRCGGGPPAPAVYDSNSTGACVRLREVPFVNRPA